MELSSFVQIALESSTNVSSEDLLGKQCILRGKGKDFKIEVNGSCNLHPIPKLDLDRPNSNECHPISEEKETKNSEFHSSDSLIDSKSTEKVDVKSFKLSKNINSKKGKATKKKSTSGNQKGSKQTKSSSIKRDSSSKSHSQDDFISSLQTIALHERLEIMGTVIDVALVEEKVRVLVNFDIYFPTKFWSHGCFWKSSPRSAFVLSHFRSDWDTRKQNFACLEEKMKQATSNNLRNKITPEWMTSLPDCHVRGCEIHKILTEKEKKDRFNLPALFRSLPPLDQPEIVRTEIHPAFKDKSESNGMWSLNDTLLSFIFKRSSPQSLRTLCCVCKHLNYVVRSITPCLKLHLYPHQEQAVKWMVERESKPKPVPHPFNVSMTTANGFPFLINRLTGELHFVGAENRNGLADKQDTSDSVPDFRGGFLCDEPGLGKTITAISLILREHGKLAEPPSQASIVSTFDHPEFPTLKGVYYETHEKLNETLDSLKQSSNMKGTCCEIGIGVSGMLTSLKDKELCNQNEGLTVDNCSPPLSSKRKSVTFLDSPSPVQSPVSVLNSSLKPPTCSKSIKNLVSIALSESIVKSSPSKTASKQRGETPSEKEEKNAKVNPPITKSFHSFQSHTLSTISKSKKSLADLNLNSIVPQIASKNENIHRFSKTVIVNNSFSNIQPSSCPEFDTRKLPHSPSFDTTLFNSTKKKGNPTFESENFPPLYPSEGSSLHPFATGRMNCNELKRSKKSTPIKRCFLTFLDDDVFHAHHHVNYQEIYTHRLWSKALRNRLEFNLIFESLPRDVNNLFLRRSVKKMKSLLLTDNNGGGDGMKELDLNHFQNNILKTNHNVLTLPSNIGSKHPLENIEQDMSMNIPSQTHRYTKRRRTSYSPSSPSPNSSQLPKDSIFFPSLVRKRRSWIPVKPRLSCFKNDISNEYSSIDFPLKRNSNHLPKPIFKLPKHSEGNNPKRVRFASEDKIILEDKTQKVKSVNESRLHKSFKPSPTLRFLQPNSADGTLHPPPFIAKSKPLSLSFTKSSDASPSFSEKRQAISMNKSNNAVTENKSSSSRNKQKSSPKDLKKVNGISTNCLGPTLEKRGEEDNDMEEDEILPRMSWRDGSIGGVGGLGKQGKSIVIVVKGKEKVGVEEKREDEEKVAVEEEYYYTPHASWLECCKCKKWRRVSEGMIKIYEKLKWYCIYNLDKHHNSCNDPEERNEEDIYIQKLPGFFFKNGQETDHLPENVSFFKEILMAHKNALIKNYDVINAIQYLSQLNAEQSIQLTSAKGLTMPPSFKNTSCFSPLFLSFGLLKNLNAKQKQSRDTWHYPPNLNPDLAFDSIALQKALLSSLQSPKFEFPNRTFLSRATLVIVPAHLVTHWLGQIRTHLKHDSLRVHVIEGPEHLSLPAYRLANDYDVVITTFSRLSAEWTTKSKDCSGEKCSSPLMKIHWFRVILDEGHTLGSSLNLTNKLEMAVALKTSRRWLLTGTPTPNTPSSQVSHLQPLLRFLHESVFGDQQRLFENAIQKPFEAYEEEGFVRLHALLKRCMITTSKSMIKSIPPCTRTVKLLKFTPDHAESYNELVETVMKNILMADWMDENHEESLLNPKHNEKARTALRNVRLSCNVSGHISMGEWKHEIDETMKILCEQGLPHPSHSYWRLETALRNGATCHRCKHRIHLPWVTPHCHHLLCTSCVSQNRKECALCSKPYTMQAPIPRAENKNPQWNVPQDLIEMQPSYAQETWNSKWEQTSSSKVEYLVQKLKDIWNDEKDKNMDSNNFNNMNKTFDTSAASAPNKEKKKKKKIIIFSQFLEHMHLIEYHFALENISVASMYNPLSKDERISALSKFERDPDVNVLLMDSSGALGLDLSFVSRVFLMEPIWNRSVEEQVISRAWRMGATEPVFVETLAMKGTIEEKMLQFLDNFEGKQKVKDFNEQKLILKNLSFVWGADSEKDAA